MGSKYSQNNKDEIKPKKIFNIVKAYSIETEEISLSNQTKEKKFKILKIFSKKSAKKIKKI